MPDVSERDGVCPKCGGQATVYLSPDHDDRGHVYCEEDDCRWTHRGLIGISRFVKGGDRSDA